MHAHRHVGEVPDVALNESEWLGSVEEVAVCPDTIVSARGGQKGLCDELKFSESLGDDK